MTFISYAQNFEDLTLWRALKDVVNGFYIDVGAWDPQSDSVTLAFSERGWRGINIEPIPALHAKFVQRRPHDINLLAAVGEARATTNFFEVEGTGLSTTDQVLAEQHRSNGFKVTPCLVEVITLAAICDAHAPPVIHFLKLDCEGGERAVLAGCNFALYRPWIIIVEAIDPVSKEQRYDTWEPILSEVDYHFAWFDGLNRFYVAAEHALRLTPLLALPPNVFDLFIRAADMPQISSPIQPLDSFVAATPIFLSTEDRISLAQRCRDCDDIPKVADAGLVQIDPDGTRVQIMHNGLKVLAGQYCGEWMTRLITLCRGHHEPQEERLFHQIVGNLGPNATMIELGGNWSYYAAWFLQGQPRRKAVILEPDPANRAVGERTMQLNQLHATFFAGFAGEVAASPSPFATERSGIVDLRCHSVPELMAITETKQLDLLHCDTQGAELKVLQGCRDVFAAGSVRYVFVSTHVHHISGDPLTHARCLKMLRDCGAIIEAEHDPYESFSGDGLIVGRFGAAPTGWRSLHISHARHSEALFREPSFDLVASQETARTGMQLAERFVIGTFETLLFRKVDTLGLTHFVESLQRDGNVAGFLRSVLHSAEFATKRNQFGTEYLHESEKLGQHRLPALPTGSPFTCASLHLILNQNCPLGKAGETLVVPNDRVILPIVLVAGAWNLQQVGFLIERLDRKRLYTLLDIGANIGLVSRQILNEFSNIVDCFCLEPDPANFAALCLNLTLTRETKIHTHQIALGVEDGIMEFFLDNENCGNRSLNADAMRDRPFSRSSVIVAAAGPWLEQHLSGEGAIVWKSDTQGSDETIVAATPWPIWRRVEVAIIELWRIRKAEPVSQEFLEKISDIPNRRLGNKKVSIAEIASYIAEEDWAHEDLYLWR